MPPAPPAPNFETHIGRENELSLLSDAFAGAGSGRGRAVLVSGEAGSGKSTLVETFLSTLPKSVQVWRGRAGGERGSDPFLPFTSALSPLLSGPGAGENPFAPPAAQVQQIFLSYRDGRLIVRLPPPASGDEEEGYVISSMLSAVQSFVEGSAGQEGGIREVHHGGLRILLEKGKLVYAAVVVKGPRSEELRTEVKATLRRLEERFAAPLKDWNGDLASLKDTAVLLQPLLSRRFAVSRVPEAAAEEQERSFLNMVSLLHAATERSPAVLLLEDAHRYDPAARDLLARLARSAADCGPLLLAATWSTNEAGHTEEAAQLDEMAVALEKNGALALRLARLTRKDVAALLDGIFRPNGFPPEFKDELLDQSEGLPSFTIDILRLLFEEGTVRWDPESSSWVLAGSAADFDMPNRVLDVVRRRLGTVDDTVREVLEGCAVLGEEFEPGLVAEVLSLDAGEAGEALETARERYQLLRRSDDGYAFAHHLTRELIYEDIPLELRQEYHLRAAGAAARSGRHDAAYLLARHYTMARDLEKAPEANLKAGETALYALAPEKALHFFRNGVSLFPFIEQEGRDCPAGVRMDLLLGLGTAAEMVGDDGLALSAYTDLLPVADEGGDAPRKAEVLRRMGGILVRTGRLPEAEGRYSESLGIFREQGDLHGTAALEIEFALLEARLGRRDSAGARLRSAMESGRDAGDTQIETRALLHLGSLAVEAGDLPAAEAHYRAALAHLEAMDDVYEMVHCGNNLGEILLRMGRREDAGTILGAARKRAEDAGYRRGIVLVLLTEGESALAAGDIGGARRSLAGVEEVRRGVRDTALEAAIARLRERVAAR